MRIHCLFAFVACLQTGWGADLPRSSPEAQGISSAAVLDFIRSADRDVQSLHSFMLVRHGQVVAEGWWAPYRAELTHVLFSLSKSFTSTAIGLAVAEGRLSVDDPVLKYFPDEAPASPSPNLKAMRIRDLLRMNTGHETEPPRPPDQSWQRVFLEHPVRFKPGTHFLYNTSATYMLAAIVEKTTGVSLLEYLQPRLFEPLGIQKATWDKSPEGICLGGYGLKVQTEDIARFGQLYLQKGNWHGQQLIPAAWVEEATSFQTSNGSNPKSDWDQGYGYQFWRCQNGAYRGDGAFGQYCVVLPDKDAVIAITAGLGNMQAVLDLVWAKLLPGMSPNSLAENLPNQQKLSAALKQLALRPPTGTATGRPSISGRTYAFPANAKKIETVRVESLDDGSTALAVQMDGVKQRILCGRETWKSGEAAWATQTTQSIAASGAWSAEDTFTAQLCFNETPFLYTVRLKFAGEEVRLTSEANVGFGTTKDSELVGTLTSGE